MRFVLVLLALLIALPVSAQEAPSRDAASRLAVAVLGRVCLMGLGDPFVAGQISSPNGEFGFTDVPPDVAAPFLQGRGGVVRALRRPGAGTILLVAGQDGSCAVWSEWGGAQAIKGYLSAMVQNGGLRGGAQLVPLGDKTAGGAQVAEFYLLPTDWYARDLSKRFADDGGRQILVTAAVWPPGERPFEAVLSVARGGK